MVANIEPEKVTTSRIITPYNEAHVYVLNNSNHIPTYVQECPRCKFSGVPICLATHKSTDVKKINYLTKRFAELWGELIAKGIIE